MARRDRESLLDDEITQELRADRLSDDPCDCERDTFNDDDDDDFGHATSQAENGRG
jgi:hypothetical protein